MTLHSVVICDDNDDELGWLFRQLGEETQKLCHDVCSFNGIKHNCSAMFSDVLNKDSLVEVMARINNTNNFCCCYLHGRNNEMLNAGETIVSTTLNHYIFTKSFIYTFSCYNGNDLADCLINNGTTTFIGYCDDARCPVDCDELTANVILAGVSSFLSGCNTLTIYESIKEEYDKLIRNDSLEPLQRSCYLHNRDALIIKGDKNLTISQMFAIDD